MFRIYGVLIHFERVALHITREIRVSVVLRGEIYENDEKNFRCRHVPIFDEKKNKHNINYQLSNSLTLAAYRIKEFY